jgi:hypothetical protein
MKPKLPEETKGGAAAARREKPNGTARRRREPLVDWQAAAKGDLSW